MLPSQLHDNLVLYVHGCVFRSILSHEPNPEVEPIYHCSVGPGAETFPEKGEEAAAAATQINGAPAWCAEAETTLAFSLAADEAET